MPLFDRDRLPPETTAEQIDIINETITRLRERKLDTINPSGEKYFHFLGRWIDIYLQAHIRRGLSLIEGGLSAVENGQTIVTALCARALLEDAALIWIFIERLNKMLDDRDEDALDKFVFSKVLATRIPKTIAMFGEEYRASNILGAIDRMVELNPGYRQIYDDLSDVCHPNSHGVLWHYTKFDDAGVANFDDGARMTDNALGSLITASHMLAAAEPAIEQLEARLDVLCGYDEAGVMGDEPVWEPKLRPPK